MVVVFEELGGGRGEAGLGAQRQGMGTRHPPGIMPSICPPMPPGDTPTCTRRKPWGKYRGKSDIMRFAPLCARPPLPT